jgi:hypothetical protein
MPSAAALESAVVELIASLPNLPADALHTLATHYGDIATDRAVPPPAATLARSIAALLGRYADQAAPLEGFALLASAAHTLTRALARDTDHAGALAAARFEIDSLAAPTTARPGATATPDVLATSLRRRS